MNPDTVLYYFADQQGRRFAFLDEAYARACRAPDLEDQEVHQTTFGVLLVEQPRALIHVQQQYYWASDLA